MVFEAGDRTLHRMYYKTSKPGRRGRMSVLIKTLIQTFINYYKANKLTKKYADEGLTDDQIVYKFTVDLIRE